MLDERGDRILWGWIPETRPESEYRAAGWAGVMALPRVLSLAPDKSLRMSVAPEAKALRTSHAVVKRDDHNQGKVLAGIRISDLAGEIEARFAAKRGFHLRLHSEKGEKFAEIAFDPQQKDAELKVNGIAGALATVDQVTLRVFADGSVVEVIANDMTAITARVYTIPSSPLAIDVAEGDALESLDVWGIRPISKDRLTTPA
jgi:beta-fructofuranosidase